MTTFVTRGACCPGGRADARDRPRLTQGGRLLGGEPEGCGMVNRPPVILAFLAFCQLISSSAWAQGHFLKDLQYFRPIVADVRTSQNHLRLYRAGEVPFSNSASQGDHWFVDASFGERFSLLGYSFPTSNQEPLRIPGVSFLVDGAFHLLIDLNTESRDVINVDYRVGLGMAMRALIARFLSFRYQFLHARTSVTSTPFLRLGSRIVAGTMRASRLTNSTRRLTMRRGSDRDYHNREFHICGPL